MSFGLGKSGGNTTPSNQDKEDGAIIVRTDDNNPELFSNMITQLRLLNMRFEEAFRTNTNENDINSHED